MTATAEAIGGKSAQLMWMALVLQRERVITFNHAREHLGISRRTYFRRLNELRDAGMILSRVRGHEYGTKFIAFDEMLAPVRVA